MADYPKTADKGLGLYIPAEGHWEPYMAAAGPNYVVLMIPEDWSTVNVDFDAFTSSYTDLLNF